MRNTSFNVTISYERALGNAQILQEILPVLPPFPFSDILRDGYRRSLHL